MTLLYTSAERAVLAFLDNALPLPEDVLAQGRRCVLDLVGVAAGGFRTPQASIVREIGAETAEATGRGARLWFDGRRLGGPAAAWANATAIESLDGHDGHSLTKGHAGVALLPALLAALDGPRTEPASLLRQVVIGYELCLRAGIAMHRTAPDYHSSGSWNAVGSAILAAQVLGCSGEQILHAAGIAEYSGPRGPMMRCIEHPSMVKDSSGWGSRVGLEAALLASRGFTGRPAGLLGDGAEDLWLDLGERWRILELYFKPYPVCRWAQPAVEAVLDLRRGHLVDPTEVDRIEIRTFHEAAALGTVDPVDTEEAQYSLPHAVAAALRTGRLGATEVMGAALDDPEIRRLARATALREVAEYSRRFPAERVADVVLTLRDGRVIEKAGAFARGEATAPLSDAELRRKFLALSEPLLGQTAAEALREEIDRLDGPSPSRLIELLAAPAVRVVPT